MPTSSARPDFVIIGAMKAGSTTLFRWLQGHPGTELGTKEPGFFSRPEDLTAKDVAEYRSSFPQSGRLTGEASVGYLDPRVAPKVVMRMRAWVPTARLLCVLRDPAARLRSEYRHQVMRGRERRSLSRALEDPGSSYVMKSLYYTALAPFVEHFRDQLLAVTFESLFGESDDTWQQVLQFLQLSPATRPRETYNVSASKRAYTSTMLQLWEWGVIDYAKWAPSSVRAIVKNLLLRSPAKSELLRQQSEQPLPDSIRARLDVEVAALCRLLGWSETPWRASTEIEGIIADRE